MKFGRPVIIQLLMASLILSACSYVEMSGTMTQKTGEVMSDYSAHNDGFVAKAAGFGGRVNTAVGSTVEDVARKEKANPSGESKGKQFISANKRVIGAAINAAKAPQPAKTNSIMKAQTRLQELGYDIGRADGIMGSKTKKSLGLYQEKEGLPVTKILDSETVNSLDISED